MKFNKFAAVIILASTSLILGCGESEEIRNIAKAQDCLDQVPSTNPAAADGCMNFVSKYTSQQANILKCSITLTSGGLNTQKIVKAYKVTEDNAVANKEAVYIGFLSLNVPNVTAGYQKAQTAYPFCELSQVSGLKFIAGLAKIGSMIASINGSEFDLDDPNGTRTAVENVIDNCVNNGASCDLEDLGTTVAALSESYCQNPSSDENVCNDINTAIQNSGGDAARAAKEFLCQLKGQTFDGANSCT